MRADVRTIALIPARLDSTRLPRKQLRPVCGRAMLWYLVERMEAVSAVDTTVVATTERDIDAPLVEWAEDRGIDVFRGAHEDLLKRFRSAASAFDADYVVRANGDNPLLSPEVTQAGLELTAAQDLEFTTGKCRYTEIPVGIGPEILPVSTLSKLAAATSDPHHREHVTTYVFDNPEDFDWAPIPAEPTWQAPGLNVTVDTKADLEHLRDVIETLPDRHPAEWDVEEIIAACRSVGDDE